MPVSQTWLIQPPINVSSILLTEDFSERRVGQVYSRFCTGIGYAWDIYCCNRNILPAASPDSDWQLIKSKYYKDESEMIEFLTLIAAGFDLP